MRPEINIFAALLLQQFCRAETITPADKNEVITSTSTRNFSEKSTLLDIAWAFSPVDLKYLAEDEMDIYILLSDLQTNYSTSPEQLNLTERWIKDYEASTLNGIRHLWNGTLEKGVLMETVVGHPLMVFRMVRRFVKILPRIVKDIKMAKEMTDLYFMADPPDSEDLAHIMDNIIRLSETYNLNPAETIRGQLGKLKTNVRLPLEQAFEIAKQALKSKMYTQAYYWLVTVRDLARKESWVDTSEVLNAIDELTLEHDALIDDDQFLQCSNTSSGYSITGIDRFTTKIAELNMPLMTLKQKHENEYERGRGFWNEDRFSVGSVHNYELLCEGSTFQTEAAKSKLYCWYEYKQHLAWVIGPLKMELLDKQLNLVQIHDIIDDALIEYIEDLGAESMERATTVEIDTPGVGKVSHYRTTSAAFVKPDDRLTALDRKIEKITGLIVANRNNTIAGEAWQVASSAIGGHFVPHYDHFLGNLRDEDTVTFGDRIATFMIYLNDVELGGYTVFTEIGIAVKPLKGSALLWYNLKRNGQGQVSSIHAGCPVLYGEKWVVNKWILEHVNFQNRKCSLDPHA